MITRARAASLAELARAETMKGSTGVRNEYEVPMLPCSMPPIQLRYCATSGRSTPS